MRPLLLTILPEIYAICRLSPAEPLPYWLSNKSFYSITRTQEELSIVCPEAHVPANVNCQPGWHLLKFEGFFEFTQTGLLASVALPLAEAEISLLAVSTFNTDYVLIQAGQLNAAILVLKSAGHKIQIAGEKNVP